MDKIKTYKPGTYHDGDVKFELICWNCDKTFKVFIGINNMHLSSFKCTHCETDCEIE